MNHMSIIRALAARSCGVALVSVALGAQDVEDWQVRRAARFAPGPENSRLIVRSGKLSWYDGQSYHPYVGMVKHVGDAIVVGSMVLVAGLTASEKGALDLVSLDQKKGLVSRLAGAIHPVLPLIVAYDESKRDLFVVDRAREALLVARWRVGDPFPLVWDEAVNSSEIKALGPEAPIAVSLRPSEDPGGGVDVYAFVPSAKTRVERQANGWSKRYILAPMPGAAVFVAEPVQATGPLTVSSSAENVGMGALVSEDDQHRLELGQMVRGTTSVELPPGAELDETKTYRLRLEAGDDVLWSRAFRPRLALGEPVHTGAAEIVAFDLPATFCYVGSPRFKSTATVASSANSGALTLLHWFVATRRNRPVDITRIGSLAFLHSDVVLVQSLDLRPELSEHRVAGTFAMPTDMEFVGGRVYGQMAVLGPGPEDLALSGICAVTIGEDPGTRPPNPRLREAIVEQWVRHGSIAPEHRQGLLQRIVDALGNEKGTDDRR